MLEVDDGGGTIDRLFDALSRGDVVTAGDCLTDDARVWHCFDRIFHDRDSMIKDWEVFVATFAERSFIEIRRCATADGFVQQHLMVGRTKSGHRLAWPICAVIKMRGDRIALLEEYIDRAGHYTPDQEMATPSD